MTSDGVILRFLLSSRTSCTRRTLYSVSNVAEHVTRLLGRPVVSLEDDAEARQVVDAVAKVHAELRSLRSGIKGKMDRMNASLLKLPFGTLPLGDGVARFRTDFEQLLEKPRTGEEAKAR